MKYENFDIEDFIADEFFISWIKQDSKEANLFWRSWIAEHPEKLKTVQKAKEIILTARPKRAKPTQKDYTEVLEGILSPKKQLFLENNSSKNKGVLKFAASISILAFFLGWVYFYGETIHDPRQVATVSATVSMVTKHVPFGQKSTLVLSDGSKVKLNAGATLEFPEKFGNSKTREVYLSGEAFFDIKRDTLRPFLIKSKDVTTKVLGTSFNVKEDDGNVNVSVLTGKVKVFTEDSNSVHNEVFLVPGQQAEYNDMHQTMRKSSTDLDDVLAWKNDVIYFDKADFSSVAYELERWYGVKIEQKKIIGGTFSGRFKNKSLKEVLKGLSYTTHFEFEIENETVLIY